MCSDEAVPPLLCITFCEAKPMARQFGGIHPSRGSDRARPVIITGFVLFLLFGGIAVYALKDSGEQKPTKVSEPQVIEKQREIKMVSVLVPIQEIPNGTPLEPRMFRKETRPEIGVSERAVKDFEEIRAHYARSLIVPGQPLIREYITPVKPTNILTAAIPEGFRAVTITTDVRTSVEGFVRPGAKVDVEWSTHLNGQAAIVTIVENVKVLSAERQTQVNTPNGAPVPSTVTLLVTAKDAKKIQLASTNGRLSLSLRGDEDSGRLTGGGGITINDLLPGGSRKDQQENVDGTVTIGGVRWLLVDGKLVPSTSRKSDTAEASD
ncbi:MAG: Flp pilus assembly protein CpaB [Bdellovibrionales bacterium]|nr:Flp pilus assembly protein CpaB [Bdellovibrionales bacterium]